MISVILIVLGGWCVTYHWPQRIDYSNESAHMEDADRLVAGYPQYQYAYGVLAWQQQQPARAADAFRQAVSQDILFFDAWIKLAEAEAAMGHHDIAADILNFSIERTEKAYRWKWSQMLLAGELGMDADVFYNANYLLAKNVLVQDTLQFLYTYLDGNARAIVSVLNPAHLPAYLQWNMRWGMTDESLVAWRAMTAAAKPDEDLALQYAHFLLNHKQITPSIEIWQNCTGSTGLTNPGFERKITGMAFDWRHWGEKDGKWDLKRVNDSTAEGKYTLRIDFSGLENISFQHIYQIFTVAPKEKYRLTYEWKSRSITSDQGPFIEIFGYDEQGLYTTGPMIRGTQGWREESIEFQTPDGCRTAVLRMRRRASMRFDSKIRGTVWIDNFKLQKVDPGVQATGIDVRTSTNHSDS